MRYRVRRTPAPARLGVEWPLGTVAVYVALFGFGTGRGALGALGVVLLTVAAALPVALALRGRRTWVAGTGYVVSASPPPDSASHGRCELQLLLNTAGLPATSVRIRDPRVPVAKWPARGAALPVRVALDDPRRARVDWDHAPDADAGLAPPNGYAEPRPPHLPDGYLTYDDLRDTGPGDSDPPRGDPAEPMAVTEDEIAGLTLDQPLLMPSPPHRRKPVEEGPSSLVARYLLPGEQFWGEWRRHAMRPVRAWLALLALAIVGTVAAREWVNEGYVAAAIAAICVVGAGASCGALVAWSVGRLALTDRRLVLIEGAVRRRYASVDLAALDQVQVRQSTGGRFLNYGDLVLPGTRWLSPMRRIADLPNPNELYLRVLAERYAGDGPPDAPG